MKKIKLPYIEDIIENYYNYVINTLYPINIPNKYIVYVLSTLHILGTNMITWGIFLPSEYQPLYLLYLCLIIISYKLFKNKCFITLLSNNYSKKTASPLYIKMSTANNILIHNIIISIIAILFPKYSLYNLFKYIFN